MNHWQYEQYKQIDEFSRQKMISEIRVEKLVRQYRVYHPGIFERTMFSLADWIISIGKRLRRRYEIPSTNCPQAVSSNLAK